MMLRKLSTEMSTTAESSLTMIFLKRYDCVMSYPSMIMAYIFIQWPWKLKSYLDQMSAIRSSLMSYMVHFSENPKTSIVLFFSLLLFVLLDLVWHLYQLLYYWMYVVTNHICFLSTWSTRKFIDVDIIISVCNKIVLQKLYTSMYNLLYKICK